MYDLQQLRRAFDSKKENFEDFLSEIENEILEKNKAIIEFDLNDNKYEVNDDLLSDTDKLVKFLHSTATIKDNYDAATCDGEDLEDEGVDYVEIFEINEQYYKADVHCTVEWCSDWSVRANVPDYSTINRLYLITDYSIKDGVITINKTELVYTNPKPINE